MSMNLAIYALWYRTLRIQSGQHLLSFPGHSVHIPTAHTLTYRIGPKVPCSRIMFQRHSSPKQDFLLFKYFVSVSACLSLCVNNRLR